MPLQRAEKIRVKETDVEIQEEICLKGRKSPQRTLESSMSCETYNAPKNTARARSDSTEYALKERRPRNKEQERRGHLLALLAVREKPAWPQPFPFYQALSTACGRCRKPRGLLRGSVLAASRCGRSNDCAQSENTYRNKLQKHDSEKGERARPRQ